VPFLVLQLVSVASISDLEIGAVPFSQTIVSSIFPLTETSAVGFISLNCFYNFIFHYAPISNAVIDAVLPLFK
jgi:hypothetical protein